MTTSTDIETTVRNPVDGTRIAAPIPAAGPVPGQQPEETNTLSGRLEVDEDRDGHIDRVFLDTDGNGTFDRIEIYRRNDDKEIIRTDFDDDADGHTDRAHFDPDADGAVERIETYVRDANGAAIRTHFDDDADGRIDRTHFDLDGDGTADRVKTYARDAAGRLLRTEVDDDADGAVDWSERYARIHGLGGVIYVGFDVGDDGAGDIEDWSNHRGGAWDNPGRFTRTVYADGRLVRYEHDDDGDGVMDRASSYVRDAAGEVTRIEYDNDNDGATDASEDHLLNEVGQVVRIDYDDDNDGTADRVVLFPEGDGVRSDEDPIALFIRSRTWVVAARGDVTIDGSPQAGATLTANTAAVADPVNGLSAPGYRYQWERADDAAGANAEQIAGATQVAYTPTAADEGKFLRVTVAFTDDDGYAETKTSAWTAAVATLPEQQPEGADTLSGRLEVDENRDGYTDRVFLDTDGSGTFDRIEIYQRNDDKEIIRTDFDDDADGHTDRAHFDPDADGAVDRIESYVRDANGAVIRTRFDDEADGHIDRTWFYDASGARERIETYRRDDDGNLTHTYFDDNRDGVVDRTVAAHPVVPVETHVRDANGVIIRTHFDYEADGRIDRTHFDLDGDGTADRIKTYARDDDGRLLRTEVDDDADGAVDWSERYARRHGVGGVIYVGFDVGNDGRVDIEDRSNHRGGAWDNPGRFTRTVYIDGRLVRYEHDDDGDGVMDRASSYVRDAAGEVTRVEYDDDNDGTADASENHLLNEVGQVVRIDYDDDNDGTADRVAFFPEGDGVRSDEDPIALIIRSGAWVVAALGDVTIDGSPQVAEALTANMAAVADPVNGLSAPGYRYQWERADDTAGTNAEQIAGATQAAYTPAAADEGKFLRVTVAFTDDDGYAETKTSAWTAAVAALPEQPESAAPPPASPPLVEASPPVEVSTPEQQPEETGTVPGLFATYKARYAHKDVVLTFSDQDGDGTQDRIEFDRDRDGTADFIRNFVWNDAGDAVQIDFDNDADGTADRIQNYVWNDAGDVIRADIDESADGTVDRVRHYTWGSVGHYVGSLRYVQDADGIGDWVETYEWDGNYVIIRIDHDIDADGRIDSAVFDDDGNGATDRAETYVRNAAGDVIQTDFDDDANGTTDRAAFDDEGDGAVDRTESYVRNAAGDVIQTDYDDDVDGTTDRVAFDDDGDGAVDRIESYTYDAHGRLTKKVMAVDGEPAEEPEGVSLGRSAAGASGARGVAGKETVAADEAVARTPFESMLEDLGDDVVIRSETYTFNAAGAVVRTDYDEGDDGMIERSSFDEAGDGVIDEHRYDHDANGEPDWVGRDSDNDGMLDRLEFHGQWGAAGNPVVHAITLLGDGPAYTVAFHDGDGAQLASGWSSTGPGVLDGFAYSTDLAVVSELQTATTAGSAAALFPVDATLLAGVSQIDLAGAGAGSTDLTLSTGALAVLADGDSNYQLRIDGDGDDTLRFDVDDFTRGDDVTVAGENYEQYAGATGSFIVDPDVTLAIA